MFSIKMMYLLHKLGNRQSSRIFQVYLLTNQRLLNNSTQFIIGESKTMRRQFTEQDVITFSKLSQDYNPIHLNESYARLRFHGKRIVQGMLVATMFSSIFGNQYPGEGSIYVSQSLKFLYPGK